MTETEQKPLLVCPPPEHGATLDGDVVLYNVVYTLSRCVADQTMYVLRMKHRL